MSSWEERQQRRERALERRKIRRRNSNILWALMITIPLSAIVFTLFTPSDYVDPFKEWMQNASCDELKDWLIDNIDYNELHTGAISSNYYYNQWHQVDEMHRLRGCS